MPENKDTIARSASSRSKPQRSKEENRERAFLAASRRTDRPLKDRYESALRASAIHKQRTGRALRVTKEMVENDEMYEEVDESLAKEYRRLTADLRAEAAVLSRKLQENYFQAFASQNAQQMIQTPTQLMTPGDSPKDSFAWMNPEYCLDDPSMVTSPGTEMLPDGFFAETLSDDWMMSGTSADMCSQAAASTGPPTPSSMQSGTSPHTTGGSAFTSSPQQLWSMNQQSAQLQGDFSGQYELGSNHVGSVPLWDYRPMFATSSASLPMAAEMNNQLHSRQWSWDGASVSQSGNSQRYKYNPNGFSQ